MSHSVKSIILIKYKMLTLHFILVIQQSAFNVEVKMCLSCQAKLTNSVHTDPLRFNSAAA